VVGVDVLVAQQLSSYVSRRPVTMRMMTWAYGSGTVRSGKISGKRHLKPEKGSKVRGGYGRMAFPPEGFLEGLQLDERWGCALNKAVQRAPWEFVSCDRW
jgi:hypothetical protein